MKLCTLVNQPVYDRTRFGEPYYAYKFGWHDYSCELYENELQNNNL